MTKRDGELTVSETLAMLNICRNTLYDYERRGKLGATRNYLNHRLFKKPEVETLKKKIEARHLGQ